MLNQLVHLNEISRALAFACLLTMTFLALFLVSLCGTCEVSSSSAMSRWRRYHGHYSVLE